MELSAGFVYAWGAAAEYFGKLSACLAISVRRESFSVGDRVFVAVLYLAQALQALVLYCWGKGFCVCADPGTGAAAGYCDDRIWLEKGGTGAAGAGYLLRAGFSIGA